MSDLAPEPAIAALAEVLVAKAVPGWARLIWRATLYSGAFEERVEVVLESGAVVPPTVQLRMGLVTHRGARVVVDRVRAALRAAVGGDRHAVELTIEPGRFEAVVSTALTQSTGHLPPVYQVAVDESRPAEHESADVENLVVAAGDPRRIVELARTYNELYAEVMGQPLELRPPAGDDEIAAAERALGVSFPADLRALYRMADGETGDYGLFGGPTLLPLETVVERWQSYSLPDDDQADRVVIEGNPPGTIRRVSRHRRWIPFTDHGDGNMFAVDLAPGPRGTAGQVIEYGSDHDDEPVSLVAGSVTDLLAELVAMLRAGDIDADPGERFWMFPSYTKAETPDYSHHVRPDSQSLQEWVATLSDPGHVQELWIHQGGAIDLSPVAAMPRLRLLRVQDSDDVTGVHALRSCPLELLTVTARQVDLTDLAGHPALRHLKVHGRVAGLDAVTRLPALRHLTLDEHQWARLLPGPPPNLATASLTGVSSLLDATNWARQVTPATAGHWQYRGSLDPER